MPVRRYSNTASPVGLTTAVDAVATSLEVSTTATYPSNFPFLLSIERATSREEVVLCTAKTGTSFTVQRGYDGTTARAHEVGSLVEHSVAAIDYREAGIARVTTAERDALAGDSLWAGRVIYNTTLSAIQRYTGSAWAGVQDQVMAFSVGGALSVGPRSFRWYPPYPITIVSFRLSVGVAPVGAAVIFDVNKVATTVYTTPGNRPQVAAGAFVGSATVPDVTSVLDSEYLQVDVDQVGSTDPGQNATLTMQYRRA